jgi:hypothetical protein
VIGRRGEVRQGGLDIDKPIGTGSADSDARDFDAQLGGQLVAGLGDLIVEIRPDAVDGQRADRDREGAEDDEGQQGRDAREAYADRQLVEAGGKARNGAP